MDVFDLIKEYRNSSKFNLSFSKRAQLALHQSEMEGQPIRGRDRAVHNSCDAAADGAIGGGGRNIPSGKQVR